MDKWGWYRSRKYLINSTRSHGYVIENQSLVNLTEWERIHLKEYFSDLNHSTIEEITLFELEYGVDLTGMFEKLKELNNV